ncbi:MAG TPA: ABC transporter permease [Thermoanaerobaculia bacterium]|nr:ABC transporter permease [Thermoanaerobaculia bacterium]
MNVQNEFAEETAPATLSETRPFYWSVRRELWENRSVYMGPLLAAGAVMFAFLVTLHKLPRRMSGLASMTGGKQYELVNMPYRAICGVLVLTAFIVGVVYCLDALYGERRDRSILFWKSLPVSDRTTVLAKAAIPLVVMPVLVFVLGIAGQIVMLLLNTAVLLGSGMSPAPQWTQFKFVQMAIAFGYSLIVVALWHAPIYTGLLMVSGWARRAAVLWVALPLLAIGVIERLAFNTTHLGTLIRERLIGWFPRGFVTHTRNGEVLDPLASMSVGRLLMTPGLWIGLVLAVVFLAAAVRLRRRREPI